MSASVNRVLLLGRLNQHGVEVRYNTNGSPCASFTIDLVEVSNTGQEFITYIACECWGKKAEAASEIAPPPMTRRLWSRLYPSEVSALVIQADFVGRSRAEPRGSCFSPALEPSAPDGGWLSPQPGEWPGARPGRGAGGRAHPRAHRGGWGVGIAAGSVPRMVTWSGYEKRIYKENCICPLTHRQFISLDR
jgi:hypothetical protein